jgi:hypothetical protein
MPVAIFLRALPKFRKAPIAFVMSVRMQNVSPTRQNFLQFDVRVFDSQ